MDKDDAFFFDLWLGNTKELETRLIDARSEKNNEALRGNKKGLRILRVHHKKRADRAKQLKKMRAGLIPVPPPY